MRPPASFVEATGLRSKGSVSDPRSKGAALLDGRTWRDMPVIAISSAASVPAGATGSATTVLRSTPRTTTVTTTGAAAIKIRFKTALTTAMAAATTVDSDKHRGFAAAAKRLPFGAVTFDGARHHRRVERNTQDRRFATFQCEALHAP